MMKWVEQFDVTLDRTIDEPYYAGDILKGIVEIFCVQQVKISGLIIRVTGVAETGWRNKTTDIVFESRHAFMDEAVDLTTTIVDHCNDEFQLLEGSHTINFQARLPLDVLSTISRENCGSVRYTCTALMGIPDDDTELIAGNFSKMQNILLEKTFTLFSVLNLDAPYLREPTTANEEEMMNGCCGHQVGSIAATLCIHEIGILPGETVRITLTIENKGKKKRWRRHKEKHECVLISLCQQLDFIAANRYDPKLIDRKSVTVAVETHGTCKARAGSGPETKEIEFKVPPALPPTSIHANRLVTCSYFFKLDLDHFDVIVPVVVGTIKHPGPV